MLQILILMFELLFSTSRLQVPSTHAAHALRPSFATCFPAFFQHRLTSCDAWVKLSNPSPFPSVSVRLVRMTSSIVKSRRSSRERSGTQYLSPDLQSAALTRLLRRDLGRLLVK